MLDFVHRFFRGHTLREMGLALLSAMLIGLSFGCEEEFIPEVNADTEAIVVEGYIEAGERPTPPYVILTKNLPFFKRIGRSDLDDIFIHSAEVKVSNGDTAVFLTELCIDDFTEAQRALALDFLGVDEEEFGFNFCVYIDLSSTILGEEGVTYFLEIKVGEQVLRSETSVPTHVPLGDLFFIDPPGQPSEVLSSLQVQLRDPPGVENYYRYFTQVNEDPMLSPVASVVDDRLFDGENFEFPLAKAETRDTEFNPETYGLYIRGDTMTIKWGTIDRAHFDFWNTLEFNTANQGPFSSYTRVISNVDGGLGVWGGMSASYYTLVVP